MLSISINAVEKRDFRQECLDLYSLVLTLYSQMEHSLGVNFFSPPSPHVMLYFSYIPCLPVLSTPLSYVFCVCMDRLMANFAGTCY